MRTDKAAFEVKSKALIAQYDELDPRALPGEHVNGALTVGETIGDLVASPSATPPI